MTSSLDSKTAQDAGVAALPRRKKEKSSKSGEASPLNIWILLQGLKRRWLPAAVLGSLLAGLVVTLLWVLQPAPKQVARSLLYVSARDPFILAPRNDDLSFDMFKSSQAYLVKSRPVLTAALKEKEPEPVAKLSLIQEQTDPIQWLEKEIQVDFAVSPETMRISMRGDNAREMLIIVNAVTKVYLNEYGDKDNVKRSKHLEQLQELLAKYEKIKQDKKTTKDNLIKAGTGNSDLLLFKQKVASEEKQMATKELLETKMQITRLSSKIDFLTTQERAGEDLAMALYFQFPTNSPATGSVSIAIAGVLMSERLQHDQIPPQMKERFEELFRADPEVQKLLKLEGDLSKQANAFRKVLPDNASKESILAIDEELKKIREKVATERKQAIPKLLDRIRREANIGSLSSLQQMQLDHVLLIKWEKVLEGEIEKHIKEEKDLGRATVDLQEITEELESTDALCKKFNTQIQNLKVEENAPRRISRLEEAAIVAEGNRTTSRLAMMGFAGLACMALVCLAFGFWETMAHRVSSPSQLIQNTGMQLMGNLPEYSKAVQSKKKNDGHYESLLSDSVDAMRTLLLFVSKMEGIRTVLVTSAVSGEGKTFSACHLAASLARAGRKTLLLDCDIRNPAVHNVFEMALIPGLCEVLRGECELTAGIHSGNVDNLTVMPAGQINELALRVLALEKTAEVFKALKKQYDFIVVDSSPVLPVPDALVISPHVDAACLSILREVSQYPKVQEAYRRLENLGVRILGAIFNGSQDETSAMYNYTLPSKTN